MIQGTSKSHSRRRRYKPNIFVAVAWIVAIEIVVSLAFWYF